MYTVHSALLEDVHIYIYTLYIITACTLYSYIITAALYIQHCLIVKKRWTHTQCTRTHGSPASENYLSYPNIIYIMYTHVQCIQYSCVEVISYQTVKLI